ncbi:hypothetical protein ACJX0J_031016 [Zea mays]
MNILNNDNMHGAVGHYPCSVKFGALFTLQGKASKILFLRLFGTIDSKFTGKEGIEMGLLQAGIMVDWEELKITSWDSVLLRLRHT